MTTNKLRADEFQQAFQVPMRNVTETAEPLLDIWPYVEAIPVPDLAGLVVADVAYVYRSAGALFEHILITTTRKNVFLVVIITLAAPSIYGHYLLDLGELYDLSASLA